MSLLTKTQTVTVAALLFANMAIAENIITIAPCSGDDTSGLQAAIDSASTFDGARVTIKLEPGKYDISRVDASRHIYHISNTASAEENPDQTKHIGLWFKNLRNITFDGQGSTLITHGEMTSFVIDSCSNITLKNFSLTAADPSVPEFTVTSVEPAAFTFAVTPPSRFEIDDNGNFSWIGEGWRFADGSDSLPEYAQVYYPVSNTTSRCPSPMSGRKRAILAGRDTVRMEFDKVPDVHVGEVYQMRHGIRNEACGFINMSDNVTLDNIEFNFLGNFGIVGQFSENLTYNNIRCRPHPGSGRTDAGFADFIQMSGCRGNVCIIDSYFEGAHDDPINIHGTHLKIIGMDKDSGTLTVRFMHGQTYGFTSFFAGDCIEIVDVHSLQCVQSAIVVSVNPLNEFEFDITLDRELSDGLLSGEYAIENVSWTPDVEIRGCYFARIPTRGILITTRGKSVIDGNTFFRIPMPAILVSDDARSWYESGPVKDLTIRNNHFIDCTSPVIAVWPENDLYAGPVHSNIRIENNFFTSNSAEIISLRDADGICITDNTFSVPHNILATIESLIKTRNITSMKIHGNRIESED